MTRTQVVFDTEFTSFHDPHLLSVGMVVVELAEEHYAELDLQSRVGRERLALTGWDVREGVCDKFGLFPEALCNSDRSLGRRVGEWLLALADRRGGRLELLYDYSTDLELLVGALDACTLLPQVRQVVVAGPEQNIGAKTGTIGPELASEATFAQLRRRNPPLYRHHALADAHALRQAWRTWQLVHERPADFMRLLTAAGGELTSAGGKPDRRKEPWLYEWLATPAFVLGGVCPLDTIFEEAGGIDVVESALVRGERGTG